MARETYIFPFLSQNLQIFKIGVIYHHRGFSQSTAQQNYINLSSHSFIHCRKNKILKFFFLTQNFFSLWWACVRWCKTFSFSLSQSFFSLCNLPQQRKVSTQLQTVSNGSQRVTTGYNGSQRVTTGSNSGGGGGKVNDPLTGVRGFEGEVWLITRI